MTPILNYVLSETIQHRGNSKQIEHYIIFFFQIPLPTHRNCQHYLLVKVLMIYNVTCTFCWILEQAILILKPTIPPSYFTDRSLEKHQILAKYFIFQMQKQRMLFLSRGSCNHPVSLVNDKYPISLSIYEGLIKILLRLPILI